MWVLITKNNKDYQATKIWPQPGTPPTCWDRARLGLRCQIGLGDKKGGLNSPADSARRVVALKQGFKRNGIYPFHIMYDTGLVEEFKDAVCRAHDNPRMQGWLESLKEDISDVSDKVIEDLVRKPVLPLWEEMKNDARRPFVINEYGIFSNFRGKFY